MISYPNESGLTSRANGAMLSIGHILNMTHVSSAVRLVMIAKVMEREPILECQSGAAIKARALEAHRFGGYLTAQR